MLNRISISVLALLLLLAGSVTVQADYTLSTTHPRVLITADELANITDRMNGPGAKDPYETWFQRIRQREEMANTSGTMTPDLMSLALLYHGVSAVEEKQTFRQWYLDALDHYLEGRVQARRSNSESRCGPTFASLISMDLMWLALSDAIKLKAFEAASGINAFYWHSGVNDTEQNFSYHGAAGRAPAFAFAALFDGEPIMEHPDVAAAPDTYSFDTAIYIETVKEELSDTGTFWRIENRIAGDPANNSALPGDFGGMYDNIGYDTGEESWSIFLVAAVTTALGEDRLAEFLHDRYRGRFYQNMEIPHTAVSGGSGDNAYEERRIEVIWNTQTDWNTSPRRTALALTATKYQDPHMQYYADRWRKILNVYNYDYYITDIWWMLCFYDDSLAVAPPSANPTARYFSGPGLVTMREDWSENAAFSVFIAGEGISRRYEDANSFLLSRKGPIVVHAGARIRNNSDNSRHHWYHIRSVSKNTMKIFDLSESFDVDSEGRITALHTGIPLVSSDNLGGQLFETGISGQDGDYPTGYTNTPAYRRNTAFELGIWNTADITKYEHVVGDYTYTVGDGTDAYVRKIDFFEREFVYLRPDVFVMFDRVRSTDPTLRKSWTIHTVDRPVCDDLPDEAGQGESTYTGGRRLTMENGRNTTSLHALLPQENRVIVRGGDTVLVTGRPLRNGLDIEGAVVEESELPRWLELFAVGADTVGSVTLYGDAEEGDGVSETIAFNGTSNGTLQTYLNTIRTSGVVTFEANHMTHTDQVWTTDQWAGYMLRLHGGAGGMYVISSNTTDQLQLTESVDSSGVWAYSIVRPLANSYYHWTRIDRITTVDMDISNFTISVPHYFDAEGADGSLYSFSPHTDSRDDGYRKRMDLGQWSVEIENGVEEHLTNFLNVFTLGDPGSNVPTVATLQGDHLSGAIVGGRIVMFANDRTILNQATFDCPIQGTFDVLIMNLVPATTYYVVREDANVSLSTTPNGGTPIETTNMGVLRATVTSSGIPQPPDPPDTVSDPDDTSGTSNSDGGSSGCFIGMLE